MSVIWIEFYISKTRQYENIFSQFGKLVKMYLGFLRFVGAPMWLKGNVNSLRSIEH